MWKENICWYIKPYIIYFSFNFIFCIIGKTYDLFTRLDQHHGGQVAGGAKTTDGYEYEHLFYVSGFGKQRRFALLHFFFNVYFYVLYDATA